MAVEDKYTDPDLAANKTANSAFVHGAASVILPFTAEVASGDDNLSIYRVAANVNPDLIPVQCKILADSALTITDANFGIWAAGVGGAAYDDNALADAIDFSSGFARGSEQDGLAAVAIEDVQKRIYELAGHTQEQKKVGYDLAIQTVAKGAGGDGTISGILIFVQG